MNNVKAYNSYFGGKNSNGTYQTIINRIPPHDVFMSLFLGNCAVARHIRPAKVNVLNDLDFEVYKKWQALDMPYEYTLFNKNAIDLLGDFVGQSKLDNPNTFIYLDPPYLLSTRSSKSKGYKQQMNETDHAQLLSKITAIGSRVMISHYPNELYNDALRGWNVHDFYSLTHNGMRLERLYYNYEVTDQLHDYRYLGDDFRERERNTRIINNMVKKLACLEPALRNAIVERLLLNH